MAEKGVERVQEVAKLLKCEKDSEMGLKGAKTGYGGQKGLKWSKIGKEVVPKG